MSIRDILDATARRADGRPCWRLSDYARAELLKYGPCQCVECRKNTTCASCGAVTRSP